MTRPDIAFAVSKLGSFNNCWSALHFKVAKALLRYLVGTKNHGIRLGGSSETLKAYVDADHQGCLDTRRSTTGWAVTYNGGVIAWKTRKQPTISHSTAESEIIALDDVARDLVWERWALTSLGVLEPQATEILVDNRAAVDLARNRTAHDTTKHIHAKYLWVRQLISSSHCFLWSQGRWHYCLIVSSVHEQQLDGRRSFIFRDLDHFKITCTPRAYLARSQDFRQRVCTPRSCCCSSNLYSYEWTS